MGKNPIPITAAPAPARKGKVKETDVEKAVANILDTAIKGLLREEETQSQTWFAKGKIVDECVNELRRVVETKKPFQLLASHEDAIHKESQLRNYSAVYRLWRDLGGEAGAPKAAMTCYLRVLRRAIKTPEKKELLERVVREGLSVAQLTKIVDARLKELAANRETPTVTIDWNETAVVTKRAFRDLESLKIHMPQGHVPVRIRKQLIATRAIIDELLGSNAATIRSEERTAAGAEKPDSQPKAKRNRKGRKSGSAARAIAPDDSASVGAHALTEIGEPDPRSTKQAKRQGRKSTEEKLKEPKIANMKAEGATPAPPVAGPVVQTQDARVPLDQRKVAAQFRQSDQPRFQDRWCRLPQPMGHEMVHRDDQLPHRCGVKQPSGC